MEAQLGRSGLGDNAPVSLAGTDSYRDLEELPPLVRRAVDAARGCGFDLSCRVAHGRLLASLAGGVGDGRIGETGTGCGVGLAWLASGAGPSAQLVSVELDAGRADVAREVFADDPRVTIVVADWSELEPSGPFDLLSLDGGGQGKRGETPMDPVRWLRPGGVLIMDDFVPADTWPPRYAGAVDDVRLSWLAHPALRAIELRTEPDQAVIVATLPHR
jgi:predicted O-methyltransferase YrrM